MSKIKDILNFAMRMEKDAGDFYSYYIDKVKSPSTKELFEELAQTENKHYEILKSKFDELGFENPPATISWVVDNTSAAKDPHILADNSDMLVARDTDSDDLTIIRMAYLIESDFAAFYSNAEKAVDDPAAKEFLRELSKWEEQHRDLFYKRYQALMQKHWNDISAIIFPA